MNKRVMFGVMALSGTMLTAVRAKAQFRPCVWPNTCSVNTVRIKVNKEIILPCKPNTICVVSR